MQMRRGAAFMMPSSGTRIPVTKRWVKTSDNRTCLIEQVRLVNAAADLKNLPPPEPGTVSLPPRSSSAVHDIASGIPIPRRRLFQNFNAGLKTAQSKHQPKGFAIDYDLVTSQTNLVMQCDTTYYVSGTVSLSGTNNVVEGLTVIKFANSANATLSASSINFKTGLFLPAIFTGKDDDNVGETISGSTGNPTTNFYAGVALDLSSATNAPTVSSVRFCYLSNALAGANIILQDSQIVNCNNGFGAGSSQPTLLNVLVYAADKLLANTSAATLTCENVTAHYCTNFVGNNSGTINLTNCLFVCVTNWQCTTTLTNCDAFLNSDVAVFTTSGGGAHYLAASSPYRNAGTTNISGILLAEIAKQTTYKPLVCSNTWILANATFTPVVQRDVDTPDLGYHYYPLDYLFCSVKTTNASTITIAQGTSIGMFNNSDCYGLDVDGASTLVCQGSPIARNWLVSFNTVQEFPLATWNDRYNHFQMVLDDRYEHSLSGALNFRFTSMSLLAESAYLLNVSYSLLNCQDCEFHGRWPTLNAFGSVHITNCFFERAEADFGPDVNNAEPPGYVCSTFCNNLFFYGYFEIYQPNYPQNVPVVRDNLFDQTYIYHGFPDDRGYNGGNNAYVTNFSRLLPTASTDIVLAASLSYQTGPLGFYYEPVGSSLFNAGSITADLIGLFHYSAAANQIKETNSVVDIGYHYVPVDINGKLLDSDGDFIADYMEDTNGNGNGSDDPTSWQIYNSGNGVGATAALQVFTPLK
jgi:hypothetical protein